MVFHDNVAADIDRKDSSQFYQPLIDPTFTVVVVFLGVGVGTTKEGATDTARNAMVGTFDVIFPRWSGRVAYRCGLISSGVANSLWAETGFFLKPRVVCQLRWWIVCRNFHDCFPSAMGTTGALPDFSRLC